MRSTMSRPTNRDQVCMHQTKRADSRCLVKAQIFGASALLMLWPNVELDRPRGLPTIPEGLLAPRVVGNADGDTNEKPMKVQVHKGKNVSMDCVRIHGFCLGSWSLEVLEGYSTDRRQ